jgi:hypothetical protein
MRVPSFRAKAFTCIGFAAVPRYRRWDRGHEFSLAEKTTSSVAGNVGELRRTQFRPGVVVLPTKTNLARAMAAVSHTLLGVLEAQINQQRTLNPTGRRTSLPLRAEARSPGGVVQMRISAYSV